MSLYLQLVDSLYQSILDRDWSNFLHLIRDTTSSSLASVTFTDRNTDTPLIVEFEHINDEVQKDDMDRFLLNLKKEVWYQKARNLPNNIFSSNTTLPNNVNAEKYLGVHLNIDENTKASLILQRDKSDKNFQQEVSNLIVRISKHVNKAFILYNRLELNNDSHSLYQTVINNSTKSLVIVNQSMKILLMNETTEKLLSMNPLLTINKKHITSVSAVINTLIQNFVEQVINWLGEKKQTPLFTRISLKGVSLLIRAHGFYPDTAFDNYSNPCCLLELIEVKDKLPDWDVISEIFRLAPRELEVLKLLNQNSSLIQIADFQSVTLPTVKSQATKLRLKMHVTTQAEMQTVIQKFCV